MHTAEPRWLCAYVSRNVFIFEWMLAGSIPHVDGACIWLPICRHCCVCLWDYCVCLFSVIKEIFFRNVTSVFLNIYFPVKILVCTLWNKIYLRIKLAFDSQIYLVPDCGTLFYVTLIHCLIYVCEAKSWRSYILLNCTLCMRTYFVYIQIYTLCI